MSDSSAVWPWCDRQHNADTLWWGFARRTFRRNIVDYRCGDEQGKGRSVIGMGVATDLGRAELEFAN